MSTAKVANVAVILDREKLDISFVSCMQNLTVAAAAADDLILRDVLTLSIIAAG